MTLAPAHPTSVIYVDESGTVADDYFAVGALQVSDRATLRELAVKTEQLGGGFKLHFSSLGVATTPARLAHVKECLDFGGRCLFGAALLHRSAKGSFGPSHEAYRALLNELLVKMIGTDELVVVLMDLFSAPYDLRQTIKQDVNDRLGRLAVVEALELPSDAVMGLQLADLMVSAVRYQFLLRDQPAPESSTTKAEAALYLQSEVYDQTAYYTANGVRCIQDRLLLHHVPRTGPPTRGKRGGARRR